MAVEAALHGMAKRSAGRRALAEEPGQNKICDRNNGIGEKSGGDGNRRLSSSRWRHENHHIWHIMVSQALLAASILRFASFTRIVLTRQYSQ